MKQPLRHVETLVYYDGPVLALAKDRRGQHYLCLAIESQGSEEQFAVFSIIPKMLEGFRAGAWGLRSVMEQRAEPAWYIGRLDGDKVTGLKKQQVALPKSGHLPKTGFYLGEARLGGMPYANFRFFALEYLHAWLGQDEGLCQALQEAIESQDKERIASALNAIAKSYLVARSLPAPTAQTKKRQEAVRLFQAAAMLTAVDNLRGKPVEQVNQLADNLERFYGRRVPSAASKFLWFRHKEPVVIYDNRARACLEHLAGRNGLSDYGPYYATWRETYSHHEPAITAACNGLVDIQGYTLAAGMEAGELQHLVSAPWFRERVFDRALLYNGDLG